MPPILRRLFSIGLRLPTAKWLVLAGLVGVLCGVVGFLFQVATDLGMHLILGELAGFYPVSPSGEGHVFPRPADSAISWPALLAVLIGGGCLAGWIAQRFAPEAAGGGTDAALAAFHRHRGRLSLRATLAKFAASVATLSSGGSAGREGPIAMLGAGFASWAAQRLHLAGRDRRILLAAGIAAGIAAIFKAPLAGALFAAEVLYADPEVEADVLIPGSIAAIVAFVVFGVLEGAFLPGHHGLGTLFSMPALVAFTAGDWAQLLGYLLIALAVAGAARGFVQLSHRSEAFCARSPLPAWLRPGIGAGLAGLVAIVVVLALDRLGGGEAATATLGPGYGVVQTIMNGGIAGAGWTAAIILAAIALGKVLTTVCTVASGGSGGVFGPGLVIGGCVGGAIGHALQAIAPAIAPPVPACAVMGMAGFFAGIYKVPIAAVLMVTEVSGTYSLLLPALWVCIVAYLLSGRQGIDRSQVRSPVDSPAHRGHFFNDILAGIRVAVVFDPGQPVATVRQHDSIETCKRLVTETVQNVYPVVDAENRLVGLFTIDDLRAFLYDEELGLVAVAEDVASRDPLTLRPTDTLASALRRFTEGNLDEVPVLDDDGRFLGLLSRRQVIGHYNRTVEELRAERKAEGWDEAAQGSGSARRMTKL